VWAVVGGSCFYWMLAFFFVVLLMILPYGAVAGDGECYFVLWTTMLYSLS
jgi:hypothetical protein